MKKLLSSPFAQPNNPIYKCENGELINIGNAYASSMGTLGAVLVTGTALISGEFSAMVVLEDATFTTLTITGYTKNGLVTPVVGSDWGILYQGFSLGGVITECKLATGKILLIK